MEPAASRKACESPQLATVTEPPTMTATVAVVPDPCLRARKAASVARKPSVSAWGGKRGGREPRAGEGGEGGRKRGRFENAVPSGGVSYTQRMPRLESGEGSGRGEGEKGKGAGVGRLPCEFDRRGRGGRHFYCPIGRLRGRGKGGGQQVGGPAMAPVAPPPRRALGRALRKTSALPPPSCLTAISDAMAAKSLVTDAIMCFLSSCEQNWAAIRPP